MPSLPTVAVSGVTGFIGAEVAYALLSRGYTVHGTARRQTPDRLAHLTTHPNAANLRIFDADLNTPNSFDAAVAGCRYAIHVASPYASNVSDPQTQLVDPAVNGTLSFLRSCRRAGVEKVVLTSSIAAMADAGSHGAVVDESHWNQHSSLKRLPYFYSKTCAEKAAWHYVEKEAAREGEGEGEGAVFKLVVVNPVMVIGPSRVASLNESAGVLVGTATGRFGAVLDMQFTTVDVRDVADAHVLAMEKENAEGRYICAADELLSHMEITEAAREVGLKPPMRDARGRLMSAIVRALSYIAPGGDGGVYVRNHLGNPVVPTNAKIRRDLGITFRGARETARETFEDLISRGYLKKRAA